MPIQILFKKEGFPRRADMVFTPHANPFRHPTFGNPSPGKLFRHDEACDRAPGGK